jgi:glycosyltransferase involved in cell wall biosynthesis
MEQQSKVKMLVAIFAYNEEKKIGNIIKQLAEQTLLTNNVIDLKLHVLVNGSSDDTVLKAQEAISKLEDSVGSCFVVHDLKSGGKSRTWNYFTEKIVENTTTFAFFLDADITLVNNSLLNNMLNLILKKENLNVVCSNPVKDININRAGSSLIEKLIMSASGKLKNPNSICGQLYLARLSAISDIKMPIGLPVEDSFLGAMVGTNFLLELNKPHTVLTDASTFHIYESIRTFKELLEHQTRIVIGGAINKLVFDYVNKCGKTKLERTEFLKHISKDEDWLDKMIKKELPMMPYGYIPLSFLTKRFSIFSKSNNKSLKSIFILIVGSAFDYVVFLIASYKMSRGAGAGHW